MKIRTQADDFFNAYRVLRESNDTLFAQAQKTGEKVPVDSKAFGALPAMGPSVVCLAFSVELYVKDLHFALNNKAPRGHSILKLYAKLP
ncbi:MAG TPA: hypothetical protein VK629_03080, partial [Steroidobacteraceae bacterium]|nr:hypothetical protein [Steroidobacteraceae bacterium]